MYFTRITSSCSASVVINKSISKLGFSYIPNRCVNLNTSDRAKAAYDGEGKTTVSILNKELENGLLINSYSQIGFRLNNGISILGSMILFTRSVLSWKIMEPTEITESSLRIFKILEPKIDIIVVGYGDRINRMLPGTPKDLERQIHSMAFNLKLNVEILPTHQAAATYNFLVAEGRAVGGAMIPPRFVDQMDTDIVNTKADHNTLFQPHYGEIV